MELYFTPKLTRESTFYFFPVPKEMKKTDIEAIEVRLLLESVFERYGYDFRHYSRASIERRVRQSQVKSGCSTISDMIPKL